jgi:predicted metal-dependent hydrolase
MSDEVYIGDGVYVSFDGYQIWLAANDRSNRVVALEPGVFFELVRVGTDIYKKAYGPKITDV